MLSCICVSVMQIHKVMSSQGVTARSFWSPNMHFTFHISNVKYISRDQTLQYRSTVHCWVQSMRYKYSTIARHASMCAWHNCTAYTVAKLFYIVQLSQLRVIAREPHKYAIWINQIRKIEFKMQKERRTTTFAVSKTHSTSLPITLRTWYTAVSTWDWCANCRVQLSGQIHCPSHVK